MNLQTVERLDRLGELVNAFFLGLAVVLQLLPVRLLGSVLLELLVLSGGRRNVIERSLVELHEVEDLGETFQFLGHAWTRGSERGALASVWVCGAVAGGFRPILPTFRARFKRVGVGTLGVPFLRRRTECLQHIKSFSGWSLARGNRRRLLAGHVRVVR